MIKLNLGCAVVHLDGYINIDKHVDADLQHDLLHPLPYLNETIDEILASHLLEHFTMTEARKLLDDWHRVLKPNGILHIRVPDLVDCLHRFINASYFERWDYGIKTIYGGQWNEGEYHKNGFDRQRLIDLVKGQGFKIKEELSSRKEIDDKEFNIMFTKKAKI